MDVYGYFVSSNSSLNVKAFKVILYSLATSEDRDVKQVNKELTLKPRLLSPDVGTFYCIMLPTISNSLNGRGLQS